MKKFCPKCGHESDKTDLFCEACGYRFNVEEPHEEAEEVVKDNPTSNEPAAAEPFIATEEGSVAERSEVDETPADAQDALEESGGEEIPEGWLYMEGDVQKGPVSRSEAEELVKKKVILKKTLVYKKGFRGWTKAAETELFRIPATGPVDVSDKWVWCMILVPVAWALVATVFEFPDKSAGYVSLLIFLIFYALDYSVFRKKGVELHWGYRLLAIFVSPVWYFVRGKKTLKNDKKPVIVGSIVYILEIVGACILIASSGISGGEGTLNQETTIEQSIAITPAELFENMAKNATDSEDIVFELTDSAKTFLKDNSDLFPCDSEISDDSINYDYDYRKIVKNPDKYGDKLIMIPFAIVLQATETKLEDGSYFTEVLVTDIDAGCEYSLFYIGELEDVVEDEYVSCIGLPLGEYSFSNVSGGTTISIPIAASQVEVLSDEVLQQLLYTDWYDAGDWDYDDEDYYDWDYDFDYD